MKGYVFKVVIEPDEFEDGTPAFHAYCPALKGARTFGKTQREALDNIQEVVQMIVDGLKEEGRPIPPDIQIETLGVLVNA